MLVPIHIINVLITLLAVKKRERCPVLLLSFIFFSLVLLLMRRNDGWRFNACKLCSGRAISATTSAFASESTGMSAAKSLKYATKKRPSVFQRANRTRFRHVESNRRLWFCVTDVIFSVLVASDIHSRWIIFTKELSAASLFARSFYDSKGILHAL